MSDIDDKKVVKENYLLECNGSSVFTRVASYLKWIEETIGGPEEHC